MKYIIGMSGGVDSCFALVVAIEGGLDVAAAVTFDNGWDDPVAGKNADAVCSLYNVPRKTYSCDLNEFHEIQRAFLLGGTMHAECPSDVAIKSSMLRGLKELGADQVITGSNWLEGKPKPDWSVVDGLYVKDVVRKHGRNGLKLKTFPNMNLWDHIRFRKKIYPILDDMSRWRAKYEPEKAKELLKMTGWQDYKVKHHENLYTKFNQLYRFYKFGVDMRTIEIDHSYDLSKPPAPREEFEKLGKWVCGILDLDFKKLMDMPPRNWRDYRSYRKYILRVKGLFK